MIRRAGRVQSSPFLSLCVLCIFWLAGCSDPNIIPAGKIPKGQVTLSWTDLPGAVSYNIYFDEKAGLTKWTSHKIPNASNLITVTDLALGKKYFFGIAVVTDSGESSILSEKPYTVSREDGSIHFDNLAPASSSLKSQAEKELPAQSQPSPASDRAPSHKEAEDQNRKEQGATEQLPKGQATLAWDNVPNATSYNIYWGESPGVTKRNGKKIANATNPYTLKGLARGKTYYFVVTAVSNSGESRESEEFSLTLNE